MNRFFHWMGGLASVLTLNLFALRRREEPVNPPGDAENDSKAVDSGAENSNSVVDQIDDMIQSQNTKQKKE